MSLATLLVLWSAVGCALAPLLGRLLRDAAQALDEPADRLASHERPRAPPARTRRSRSAAALGSSR